MVQYGRSSRSSWTKSVWSSFSRTIMGKAVWESPIETWLGENSKLGMSLCSSWKRIILICLCGWHKIGWKDKILIRCGKYLTKKSISENQHLSWIMCTWDALNENAKSAEILWTITEPCSNLEFLRVDWKNYILSKQSYLFMDVWHGWSCKEVCGTIWWVGKQDDPTITKYLLHASLTTTSKKKKQNLLENCQIHALKLFWNVYIWQELDDPIFYGQ